MRYLIAALALLCGIAQAQPAKLTETQVQSAVKHCKCVMEGACCILDTRPKLETSPMVLQGTGLISVADRNYLVLSKDGMCAAAEAELRANSISPRSMVARSKWQANWLGPCPCPPVPQPTVKPGARPATK
jgi:hypothetical protein